MYLCDVTYRVTRYGILKGIIKLQRKSLVKTTTEVCIGNDLETLRDVRYNEYLIGRLERESSKAYGCQIEILKVESIQQCGSTTDRF